jgi:hypothetical protein
MRIVLLLVVVAIIGITTAQMLNRKPPEPVVQHSASKGLSLTPPTVPTRPQDVKAFEQDMNRFMQDTARQQGNKDVVP